MTHRTTLPFRALVIAPLAALLLAACGSDPVAPDPQVIEETEFNPLLEVELSAMTETASGLYYQDILVGEGNVASPGDSATVRYAGFLANGRQFDGGEFTFLVDGGSVIPGFDEGVQGMAVGGARKLVIPPDLAYGDQGAGGGVIPPGSILVFDVQLRAVREPPF